MAYLPIQPGNKTPDVMARSLEPPFLPTNTAIVVIRNGYDDSVEAQFLKEMKLHNPNFKPIIVYGTNDFESGAELPFLQKLGYQKNEVHWVPVKGDMYPWAQDKFFPLTKDGRLTIFITPNAADSSGKPDKQLQKDMAAALKSLPVDVTLAQEVGLVGGDILHAPTGETYLGPWNPQQQIKLLDKPRDPQHSEPEYLTTDILLAMDRMLRTLAPYVDKPIHFIGGNPAGVTIGDVITLLPAQQQKKLSPQLVGMKAALWPYFTMEWEDQSTRKPRATTQTIGWQHSDEHYHIVDGKKKIVLVSFPQMVGSPAGEGLQRINRFHYLQKEIAEVKKFWKQQGYEVRDIIYPMGYKATSFLSSTSAYTNIVPVKAKDGKIILFVPAYDYRTSPEQARQENRHAPFNQKAVETIKKAYTDAGVDVKILPVKEQEDADGSIHCRVVPISGTTPDLKILPAHQSGYPSPQKVALSQAPKF